MRRRLYFVLPNVGEAEQTEKALLLARVENSHMHFMAKDSVDLHSLHEASPLQKTDILHALKLGLVAGLVTGIVVGTGAYFFFKMTPDQVGLIAVIGFLGALIGMWSSSLIGISIPNTQLRRFKKQIDKGRVLLMVDVPVQRVDEIRQLVSSASSRARDFGVAPTMPAFP